jgi:serine/threonine protein kinase
MVHFKMDVGEGQNRHEAREHDLLSFLSVVVHEYSTLEINLTLLSVVLDDQAVSLRPSTGKGSYCSVSMADGKRLLQHRHWKADFQKGEASFPSLVAVKSAIIDGDVSSSGNRRIWTSMALELQILRNPHLSAHPNVVSLLGVCWQPPTKQQELYMPALVMEAASMNLEEFMLPGKAASPRKMLGLAIDITAGMRAIHAVGVAHCDIKPQNVLIFKSADVGYTAKITDFGSALLLSNVKDRARPPGGSSFWRAPECSGELTVDGFVKADSYSLGLIVWNLLTANLAVLMMQAVEEGSLDLGMTLDEVKSASVINGMIVQSFEANREWLLGPYRDGDPDGLSELKQMQYLLLQAINPDKSLRIDDTRLLKGLRILLHHRLRHEFFTDLDRQLSDGATRDDTGFTYEKMNSQEQDIWLYPGMHLAAICTFVCN